MTAGVWMQADHAMVQERRMMVISRILLLTLALIGGTSQAAPAGQTSGGPLILAVHPYLPAPEIQRRFGPLASHLGRALGRPVSVRVGQDYDQHIAAIGQDEVDIAFLGPASYVRMVDRHGRKPILGRFQIGNDPYLYGVIAVRRDSPLQRLEDLEGRRFAFGDPESTMSHLVPRHMLLQAGLPLDALGHYRYLGSHRNVALGVLAGDFDAGAMKREVYEEFAAHGLRLLALSPPTPDHLFVARANLPAAEVTRLRQALLALHAQPGGRDILKRLHPGLTALVASNDGDYDGLRAMIRSVDGASRP
jgi:phosphonate transport system substrate-binding protein